MEETKTRKTLLPRSEAGASPMVEHHAFIVSELPCCHHLPSSFQDTDLSKSKNPALRAEKQFLLTLTTTITIPLIFKCLMAMFFRTKGPMFFLSLISKHEMLRMELVLTDGSLFTVRQHQLQMQIL